MSNPLGDIEITDPQVMRALAHPVRMAILTQLRWRGPATATELSPHVGATPSVASWHLRQLAGCGLVQDAEPGPDRRQRRWEAVAKGFRFELGGEGEAGDAARGLALQMFLDVADLPQRWLTEVEPQLPPEWRRLGGLAHTRVALTPEELEQLGAAVEQLLAPYVTRAEQERPAGAQLVRLMRYVLPELPEGEDA
ncbi:transcriptional regulator [Streptomyces tateyamensis]|uniref:Transcriptional regulator n=1 Tax=Streptomyces tateyamensis TaxID=565073 RepID=A0A2V4N2D8_9ACTN|nr:helix-turn-helix domain-containing protein [Streptomyces tateyamensis]PYC71007.1 transcriptional regulator [Streptomyces tateyamensis]